MRIQKCSKCGHLFSVAQIGGGVPGGLEPEDIDCPSCSHVNGTESISGYFQTALLTPEEEEAYRKGELKSE
jgi:DNA-directed RNA polymerase subunit RPC12/RpoP